MDGVIHSNSYSGKWGEVLSYNSFKRSTGRCISGCFVTQRDARRGKAGMGVNFSRWLHALGDHSADWGKLPDAEKMSQWTPEGRGRHRVQAHVNTEHEYR